MWRKKHACEQDVIKAIIKFIFETFSPRQSVTPDYMYKIIAKVSQTSNIAGTRLDAYCERLLGNAFPWAQACALIQPLAPGIADRLRCEYFTSLPASVIQRVYALPGTWENTEGIFFSQDVLRFLIEGFRVSFTPEEQEEIISIILKILEEATPIVVNDKGNKYKLSLAELKFITMKGKIRIHSKPDEAIAHLAKIVNSPLGQEIKADLAFIRPRKDTKKMPLYKRFVKPGAQSYILEQAFEPTTSYKTTIGAQIC